MDKPDNTDGNDISPERIVEEALLKLSVEHPECRDIINNLISLSRENQREVLKRLDAQEAQPAESKNNLVAEEMLKFAQRFYKARQVMGLPQWECGKKAGVSSRTIALIERTSIDGEYVPFYMHVKNISKRDLAKDSMLKLGEFLSIPKDELEDWWSELLPIPLMFKIEVNK